ncbi:hypothetical protein Tco_1028544 [Tanacetum coccineum]|uniref:Uncharacterized protein n=1 Tax=Tanacetum coccineum TaxID=301880 RepID=A0ABQ5G253_9ASTR
MHNATTLKDTRGKQAFQKRKTYDIGSFIKWFCRRTGKKKLCKADLEGPAFNLVKAFHKNSVFLQYQMDECHKLLTIRVDLSNLEVTRAKIALSHSPSSKARLVTMTSALKISTTLWVERERERLHQFVRWHPLPMWIRRKEFYINKHSEPLIVKQSDRRCEFSV